MLKLYKISIVCILMCFAMQSRAGVPYCNNYCDCYCQSNPSMSNCGSVVPASGLSQGDNCMAQPANKYAAYQTTCTYYCNQATSSDKQSCAKKCTATQDVLDQRGQKGSTTCHDKQMCPEVAE